MQLKVPSIACEVCAKSITTEIQTQDPHSKVEVDVENKVVTVETKASEAEVTKMIEAAGHTVSC